MGHCGATPVNKGEPNADGQCVRDAGFGFSFASPLSCAHDTAPYLLLGVEPGLAGVAPEWGDPEALDQLIE